MIRIYIQNPNSLILAISPANYDLANSDSLKLAKEVDPSGERTLGVITKMDRAEESSTQIKAILEGKLYPLKMGFIGVKCRNQSQTEQGFPMERALLEEQEFFRSHPNFRPYCQRMGIPFLTRKLSEYLVEHLRQCAPLIRNRYF